MSFDPERGPYVSDLAYKSAMIATLELGALLRRAVSGEKLSTLAGRKNEAARAMNSSGVASIVVGTFDRSDDSVRRSERSFRKHGIPFAATMAHPDFVVHGSALSEPGDYSTLAELMLPSGRHLSLTRTMIGAVELNGGINMSPAPDSRGILPTLVNYNLLVIDPNRQAGQA